MKVLAKIDCEIQVRTILVCSLCSIKYSTLKASGAFIWQFFGVNDIEIKKFLIYNINIYNVEFAVHKTMMAFGSDCRERKKYYFKCFAEKTLSENKATLK